MNFQNYDMDLYIQVLNEKKVLKTTRRNTLILPIYSGKIIYVYNGKMYKKVRITEDKIGTKLGQYVFTRKLCKHKKKK